MSNRLGIVLVLAIFTATLLPVSSAEAANCDAYPYTTLQNGTTADAGGVMDNFNQILGCANNSLAPKNGPLFTGDVGIGTTSPTVPLQVERDTGSGEATLSVINATDGTGSGARINVAGGSSGAYSELTLEQYAPSASGNIAGISIGGLSMMLENAAPSYGATGLLLGSVLANPIHFITGNTERMTIDGSGNVGIGTSAPAYTLDVSGSVHATGGYYPSSDARLKKDIKPLAMNALNIVARLKPVTFKWRSPKDIGMRGEQIGFIAQDVQSVLPDLVVAAPDAAKTLSLNYDGIIPVLTKALQQQQKEIATLRKAIATLSARNAKQARALSRSRSDRMAEVETLRRLSVRVDSLERASAARTSAR